MLVIYLFTAYIIEIQALNGMRIGELLAIQPENIDFKNKNLSLMALYIGVKRVTTSVLKILQNSFILSNYLSDYSKL